MLSELYTVISLSGDLIAMFAIGNGTATIPGDDTSLFTFDILIDPGHPGIDLVRQ